MRWIGSSGIASLVQLARRYWPVAKVQTAQARLSQLVAARYLHSQWRTHRGQSLLTYALTQQGAAELPAVVRDRLHIGWPGRLLISQQLLANDALSAIEDGLSARGAKLIAWRSARELQQERAREVAKARWEGAFLLPREVPDAQMLVLEPDGSRIVIDIEVDGQYHGAMLAGKAYQYSKTKRPLLWVCTQERYLRVEAATKPYRNISILQLSD